MIGEVTAGLRLAKTTGQASRQTCSIEVTAIRMFTIDARSRTFRILASVGVFHEALRETESIYQIPRPANFRIGKTPLLANRVVGHGFPAVSKLRRSGWRQKKARLKLIAYLQETGSFARHSEKVTALTTDLVRHFPGSGRCL